MNVEFIVKFMSTASLLLKEKIVTLSELQKNPSRALDARIVRIVKNGTPIGIFFTNEEFEDIMEEQFSLQPEFKKRLDEAIKKSKKEKLLSLSALIRK